MSSVGQFLNGFFLSQVAIGRRKEKRKKGESMGKMPIQKGTGDKKILLAFYIKSEGGQILQIWRPKVVPAPSFLKSLIFGTFFNFLNIFNE